MHFSIFSTHFHKNVTLKSFSNSNSKGYYLLSKILQGIKNSKSGLPNVQCLFLPYLCLKHPDILLQPQDWPMLSGNCCSGSDCQSLPSLLWTCEESLLEWSAPGQWPDYSLIWAAIVSRLSSPQDCAGLAKGGGFLCAFAHLVNRDQGPWGHQSWA